MARKLREILDTPNRRGITTPIGEHRIVRAVTSAHDRRALAWGLFGWAGSGGRAAGASVSQFDLPLPFEYNAPP
jgi:hypothetical protein